MCHKSHYKSISGLIQFWSVVNILRFQWVQICSNLSTNKKKKFRMKVKELFLISFTITDLFLYSVKLMEFYSYVSKWMVQFVRWWQIFGHFSKFSPHKCPWIRESVQILSYNYSTSNTASIQVAHRVVSNGVTVLPEQHYHHCPSQTNRSAPLSLPSVWLSIAEDTHSYLF